MNKHQVWGWVLNIHFVTVLSLNCTSHSSQIAAAEAAKAAATTKLARKRTARQLNKALLKAEQIKASEGLMACLPVLATRIAGDHTLSSPYHFR